MTFYYPLNLEHWLIDKFAGTNELFIFLAAIFLSGLAARLNIPNYVSLILFALFIVFLSGTFLAGEISGIFVLTIMLASLGTFYLLSKITT